MSAPLGASRDALRKAYTDAWRKHEERVPLTAQEAGIADVIGLHPEYHALVRDPDAALAFEPGPVAGEQNPFLHMGLHLAIRDQVAIDRPPGIRALHQQLAARHGGAHAAEHVLMESLAEVLWQSQRDGRAPDEQRYLALARSAYMSM
jgi:hypothetical protein